MRMMKMTKRLETRSKDETIDAKSILVATNPLVYTLVIQAKNI
jgi:hypothetical protein